MAKAKTEKQAQEERELLAAKEAFFRWVDSPTFEKLEVVEDGDGRLLFPGVIYIRRAKGKLEERKIRIRVLREIPEKSKARVEARAWATELGLDMGKDGLDLDKLEGFETMCQIARCIRAWESPHEQLERPKDLVLHYDDSSLMAVWDQHSQYEAELNPRPPVVDDETVCRIAMAMRKTGSMRPLAGIDGRGQHSCVLRLGILFGTSLIQSSSDVGPETSTAE